ncbi:Hsp70 family protein [Hydrogenophaga sp. A37]|uniref:Hsp70 family protein n=1 Tax=Hydrogenophaga sp. A37 TaxID=1945864 RepID=UPI0009846F20|nr:Hsp70 family protein [Hydrogenophaga sp. A37]OOG80698.1 heat-shock protein [Hydrogenophaga sp. A37]
MQYPLAGTLGIDFGTSNSAMSWASPHGLSRLIPLEGDAVSMPTAVFFNAEDHLTHFGRDAVAQYLAGTEGRLLRSLKSLLGSPLINENTEVNHRSISFLEIVTTFLVELRERAAQTLGSAPERVVMGRPVHFVDDDAERDAMAQASLLEAAQAAGFREVSFQLEPIAAALDHERRLDREAVVLIVDIGGGTSDFTVVRLGPQRMALADRSGDVLATTGVHIGGTDFDHRLSLEQVMPLLGYRQLGPQGREVPSRVFFDLSTWHLIQWLYVPRAISQAQALRVNYSDARLHERLMRVLREKHGHHIAHEVELAKIRCSMADADTTVDLSIVEAALTAPLGTAALHEHLDDLLQRTVACARECVQRAGLRDHQLDAVYLTGGSSALRPFQETLRAAFPSVPLIEGDLFGGVASGLAYSRG